MPTIPAQVLPWTTARGDYDERDALLDEKIPTKAIAIIQFKLEGHIIKCPT